MVAPGRERRRREQSNSSEQQLFCIFLPQLSWSRVNELERAGQVHAFTLHYIYNLHSYYNTIQILRQKNKVKKEQRRSTF